MLKKIILLSISMVVLSALAGNEEIENALKNYGLENLQIKDSPIAGLKTVVRDRGIFYATEDGKYFLQGALVEITPTGPVDHTNKFLMDNLNAMAEHMVVYPAKEEKYVVNVFTDITCGYCVKLHQQIKEYNDRGITIRYIAFPRAGVPSQVADQMEAIWQAEDKQAALTKVKLGGSFLLKPMKSKYVAEQYALGLQFGISATPALLLSNGAVVEGYRSPDELLMILQREKL